MAHDIVILLIITSALHLQLADAKPQYGVTLKQDEKSEIRLLWAVDYKRQTVNLTLEMTKLPQPDPYFTVVGLGMSSRGDVTNADIAIISYNDDSVDIQDSWSDENGDIKADDHQDYHLIEYEVKSEYVSVTLWRPIDTMDEQDYTLDIGTTHLCLLQNKDESSDASSNDQVFLSIEEILEEITLPAINAKDMESYVTMVQILKPDLPPTYFGNEEEDISIFSILQPNVTLPSQVTTYWCSVGKLPDHIRGKIHAIGFGANVTKGNEEIVHHMEVFLCDPKDGDVTAYSGECGSKFKPSDVKRCNRVMGAWAKGAEDLFYPKEAGIPFGQVGESRYFRLEIHYHNPHKLSDVIDHSGMNFYYTKNIRKYDAGVLEVGITYNNKLAIPPKQKDFVLKGFCTGKCTTKGLRFDGIDVFASQLHTHLTGRKVWISHYRNGERLPDLNRDDHYSGSFQEIRHIYPSVKVMPGDSLVTSCSYNTLNRVNVTTTGDSIFQEMCVSYLHYYPLSPLEVCKSSISSSALGEFFLLQKMFTGHPKVLNFSNLGENYQEMEWNSKLVEELETTYEQSPEDIECRSHNGGQLSGSWEEETLF